MRSQAANQMKLRIERARLAALIIVVLVALCGTTATAVAASVPGVGRGLAALAALGSVDVSIWVGCATAAAVKVVPRSTPSD